MYAERLKINIAQNGAWIALVLVVVVFAIINPRFLSVGNAEVILRQVAELGIIALALAFVVMSGSIDLSVGSIASLAGVVSTTFMIATDNVWLGLFLGLIVGAVAGAINGFLISYLGLNSIVITLGFLAAWGGLALFLTNGQTLTGIPKDFAVIANGSIGPISFPFVVLGLAIVVAWFILNRRPFGKWVLAIGENESSAFLMGIPVKRTRFLLFVAAGVLSSFAGMMLVAKLQAAPPAVGSGAELDALTVVLLGGVAFAGGYGRIGGVIAGLLFVGALRNGLVVIGVSQFLQDVAVGLTLVLAIALDGSLRQVIRSSWDKLGKSSITEGSSKLESPSEVKVDTVVR
jgi:ribose/xylose/arabinose/galactoside ABC-type transport system permease subunit